MIYLEIIYYHFNQPAKQKNRQVVGDLLKHFLTYLSTASTFFNCHCEKPVIRRRSNLAKVYFILEGKNRHKIFLKFQLSISSLSLLAANPKTNQKNNTPKCKLHSQWSKDIITIKAIKIIMPLRESLYSFLSLRATEGKRGSLSSLGINFAISRIRSSTRDCRVAPAKASELLAMANSSPAKNNKPTIPTSLQTSINTLCAG